MQKQVTTLEDIRVKREEIFAIAARYGASDVRLFGSVVRGDANVQSDVDFLVSFPANYRLLDHAGLLAELQDLLGVSVDVAIEANLQDAYADTILASAIPL